MNRRLMFSLATVLVIGACSDQQDPNTESPAPGSEFASGDGAIGINVVLKAPATAANRTELAMYGNLMDEIPELNGIRVRAKASQLAAIQALPFVKSASPDAERNAIPIDPITAEDFVGGRSTWDQDAINVTDFNAGRTLTAYDGNGVNVAILDSGLLPTWRQYFPQERIHERYGIHFGGGGGDNGTVVTHPDGWQDDVNSHGTHVTSSVIGYQFGAATNDPNTSNKYNGVAPMAKIIPVKVLGQSGSGWSSAVARGIVYVTELKKNDPLFKNSPMVINMSLGGSALESFEKEAIDRAIAAGVIIVASAGNNGEAGMGFPGAYQPVISSAASGWTKQFVNCAAAGQPPTGNAWWRACDYPENTSQLYIANFSARPKAGQDLDVVAPGAWVVGPYQTNQSNQATLFFLSGTSMSSPHVAGIVALMAQKVAQKNRVLTASQAETILENSAIRLAAGCATVIRETRPQCWGTNATGSGFITATAALANTR
jgi:subtilisin family serine protease